MRFDEIPLDLINPSPYQKRQRFDADSLKRLADDIALNGLLNPILCRPQGNRYEIVHGERRWRACKLIPWATIPSQIREMTELEARRICAAENVHREDLTPVELIDATANWVDSCLMDIEDYQDFGETYLDRVGYLLGRLWDDERNDTDNLTYKFISKVDISFKATNRNITWQSFYNNDLRPYLKLDEDVKEVAIKHNLAKSKAPELQKLKEAAPRVFEEIKETGQVSLGIVVKEKYDIEDVSARELKRKARHMKLEKEYPHVSFNAGENEWYTPKEIIEAARNVMGQIDLDPASSDLANTVVGAIKYYTPEDDGLTQEWEGKVWMNPPYAQPLVTQFTDKLVEHVQSGDVPEAIVLVNNATETSWFGELVGIGNAVCFPHKRTRFWHPDKLSAPLQGQTIIYIGNNTKNFVKEFRRFGWLAKILRKN